MRFVHRALLLGMLSDESIKIVEQREIERGHSLPLWIVTEALHLPPAKEFYSLPTDHAPLSNWIASLGRQIKGKAFLSYEDEMRIEGGDLETFHAFDKVFLGRRNEVDLTFKEEETSRRGGRRLADIMKAQQETHDGEKEL